MRKQNIKLKVLFTNLECTDKIRKEEVRIMSICHDIALIKNKYKLESSYKDQLLEDLLQDEGEDGKSFYSHSIS